MEIPKNSSRKRGAAIVTDSEAKPTASERAFTEAHDSIVLCDYVSPKRPKRLSVSCVERSKLITLRSITFKNESKDFGYGSASLCYCSTLRTTTFYRYTVTCVNV